MNTTEAYDLPYAILADAGNTPVTRKQYKTNTPPGTREQYKTNKAPRTHQQSISSATPQHRVLNPKPAWSRKP